MNIKYTTKVGGNYSKSNGFSLIELLVVVGILVMITTLTLVNYSSFNSSTALGSLAYDIALSIRQAQVFGLAVREYEEGAGPDRFDTGYGAHFDIDSSENKRYILFADTDRQFDYDGATEIDEIFTIGRGNYISDICVTGSSNVEKCSADGVAKLNIIFDRPDPEAIIKINDAPEKYGSARIIVSSRLGNERVIRVYNTGQIAIE